MDEELRRSRSQDDNEEPEEFDDVVSEDDELLNLFKGRKRPDYRTAWEMYQKGLNFNQQVNLDDTVRVNRNFFVGKAA